MLPSLQLLAEIHFNQILIVACGYCLILWLFRFSPTPPAETPKNLPSNCLTFAAVYTAGILWFSLIGAIALIVPISSTLLIWALTLTLIAASANKFINLVNISNIQTIYKQHCFKPFLIFLPFAIFLLSHFTSAEIAGGIDPWLLIDRTLSYRVPDHYLQWTVSENLFAGSPIEKHFNLNGKQMWSAGDRPVLIGLLEATFSQLTNHQNISLYFLRVIFLTSLLFIAVNALMREEFGVKSGWVRILTLVTLALHPFFLVNIIFTWPKMTGLAFGMMGFLLFSQALRQKDKKYALLGGVAFALGMMSHTAAVFCFIAAALFFPLAYLLNGKDKRISCVDFSKATLSLLLPLLILTQLHSRLLSSATNQTNLLARVQLCRGGSYAFVTPVESVLESCLKYYEKQGFDGVIADRKESLSRAFNFQPKKFLSEIYGAISSKIALGDYLRSLNSPLLLLVPDSIGHLSLCLLGIFAILYLISFKFNLLKFTKTSLLLPIGFLLLFAYSCMLGEYTEMSSHVVPYIIPFFINLGILLELSRLGRPVYLLYCVAGIAFSVGVLLARVGFI